MKQYQGEKAIISLTSWKARIKTVGLTIYNLLTICPGFHIVLCLSSNEFPRMTAELPEDLQLLSRFDKIEILWVKKNYKAFKKYLFTMLKYPDVPVISADDDCIYKNNYAEELYQLYKSTHKDIIRYTVRNELIPQGPCTLYAPNNKSHYIDSLLPYINDAIIAESQDDTIASKVIAKSKLTFGCGNKKTPPFIFHDVKCPLNAGQSKQKFYKTLF